MIKNAATKRQVKKPIKKLIKPIKILINITIYTWFDKVNGNTYCSGRLIVNNDHENTVYYRYTNNSTRQAERDMLKEAISTFKGLEKFNFTYYSDLLKDGVLIDTNIIEGKHLIVKNFGFKPDDSL